MEQVKVLFKKLKKLNWMESDLKTFIISNIYVNYCKDNNIDNELLKIAKDKVNETKCFKSNDYEIGELLKVIEDLEIDNYEIFTNDILCKLDAYFGVSKFVSPSSETYLSEFIKKILDINENDIVIDIGSGYGNFLSYIATINSNITLIGQEINKEAYDCSRMVLSMSKSKYEIENVDVIKNEKYPEFSKGFIFPTFSVKYNLEIYEKYQNLTSKLFNMRSSSEWFFVYNALKSMKQDGKLAVLLPEGALFKTQDAAFREYLLDNNLIEGIISLPSGFINGIGIKTSLLILSHNNKSFKLFDASPYLPENIKKDKISLDNIEKLYESYNSSKLLMHEDDIKTIDYNLTYSSLTAGNIYEGLSDLVNLSNVVDILKGSNLTVTNFKDFVTDAETEYQILTSSDIDKGLIDYSKLNNIKNGEKYEKFLAKEGDVIITSKSTKVKLAVINGISDKKIIVTGAMNILRPKDNAIDGTYLKIFFESSKGKQILESAQKGSVIRTISEHELANLKVPCPSYDKQIKIASKYNNLMSMYEVMKKEINNIESRLENFYDSIEED